MGKKPTAVNVSKNLIGTKLRGNFSCSRRKNKQNGSRNGGGASIVDHNKIISKNNTKAVIGTAKTTVQDK